MSQDGARASGRPSRSIRFLAIALAVGLVIGVVVGILAYKALKTSSLTEPDAVVYFNSIPSESQQEALLTEISSWTEVDDAEYVSEVDRYDRLVSSLIDKRATDGMSANPFAPSIEIDLSSPLTALQIDERLTLFAGLGPSAQSTY